MATANAQRFLSGLSDGDRELALQTYWGAVLEGFHSKTLLWNAINGDSGVGGASAGPVVVSRSISGSSGHKFPIFGVEDADPEYHTPGTELLGQQFELDDGTITLDDILVAHKDIPVDQMIVSHFDILNPVGRANGRTLAMTFDRNLFVVGYKAALESAVTKRGMTIHNGGNVVTRDAASLTAAYDVTESGASDLLDDIEQLAEAMDEDNVPEDGRYLAISPYLKRVLSKAPDRLFSRDYDAAGQNMPNRRKIGLVSNFNVMEPTNHLPGGKSGENITHSKYSKYSVDARAGSSNDGICAALAFAGADEASGAVGYVTAGGVMAHIEADERRNTIFAKSQMMVGAGILAPYHAGAIRVRSS